MRESARYPHVWQVDNYPAPSRKVQGRHVISMASESTTDTQKLGLRGPVAPRHVPADGARLAGVGWIDEDDGNAGRLGFVPQEGAELVEGPSAEALSLGPRDRTKQSPGNAVQVFQRHGTLSGRRGLDDALGDRVIDVGLHPALPTGQVPQHPLGALGTLLLKAAPLPATASTGPVERRAGEHLPVAGGRKMDDAEIDAQHVCRRQWRRGIGQRQREGDAPPAFAVPEYVGLTDLLRSPPQIRR